MRSKFLWFLAANLIVSAGVVGADVTDALAINLVTNGSFEVGTSQQSDPQAFAVSVGTALIPGWQVTQSEIHLSTSSWISFGTSFGDKNNTYYSIDLDGNTGAIGGISQVVDTEIGRIYSLVFFMGGNYYAYPELERQMEVFWGNKSLGVFTHRLSTNDTPTSFNWDLHEIEVVGTGRDELRFTSLSAVNAGWGATVDLVSVQPAAVPEPTTILGILSAVGFGYVLKQRKS